MASELRTLVRESMAEYANKLRLTKARVLDVGIGGDKERPSENYKYFAPNQEKTIEFKTMDIDPKWRPDFVGDICETSFADNYWDLVILSQTLEHIFDYEKAIKEIWRIVEFGGSAVIDCPFQYPYHPEPGFDDYWRISPTALARILDKTKGWEAEIKLKGGILTTSLCKKIKK